MTETPEATRIEKGLYRTGVLFVGIGLFVMTLTMPGFATSIPSLGFGKAHELAAAGAARESDFGLSIAIGLGLLFASEVLPRLREIANG